MTVAALSMPNEFYPVAPSESAFEVLYDVFSGLADGACQAAGLPATCRAERGTAATSSECGSICAAAADDDWKAICSRLLSVSGDSLSDADLLALLMSYLGSNVRSRELAGKLIDRFGSFGGVVTAPSTQVADTADIQPQVTEFFALVRAAGTRLAREEICSRPVLDAWDKLIAYLRTTMAHQRVEQIRILFLDRRNVLIADEVQHTGTIDHTPVYPREVAKRALELDATAIIMVHNHPSNHPAPSKADIAMTQTIQDTMNRLGVILHDHIIVSRRGHSSFRTMGLLDAKAA